MSKIVLTGAGFPNFDAEMAVATKHGVAFERVDYTKPEDVIKVAPEATALIVQYAQITADVIAHLPENAGIFRYGIGLDNIDVAAANARGIRVAYVPDYATGEVADHTAALMLTTLRKIIPLDRDVRNGVWDAVKTANPMPAFSESTVGFIGFGRIGREVFARLAPFGFKGIVADPFADPEAIRATGATPVDLDTLFATADAITLHSPLTPDTHHLVNAERLAQMKPTAVIVNTARGGLIDPVALADAVKSGKIAGAGLDVFEEEPLPMDSPLRAVPNIILTPHAAWYSSASVIRLQSLLADEIDRHLAGQPARCPAPAM